MLQGMEEIKVRAPLPGTCPECAVKHDERDPHDLESLYYQYRFYKQNGRLPTWADAMRHCSPITQAAWAEKLEKRGIRMTLPVAEDADGQE